MGLQTDDVMTAVMSKLGFDIPPFRLTRYVRVSTSNVVEKKDGKEAKKPESIRLLAEV